MAKKVAEQLVDMLVEAGVKRIYAVTGDSLNEINDAVRKNGKIQWVHVRHEEVGAYAAGAEAQLHGQLACCAGSSGPGHVHLINGLYDAHRSGVPVLAIASTMATSEFGTRYFQETDTMKLFEDCSYYNQVATTPCQMPRMLQAAMQAAISGSGVAVIGVPGDVTARGAEEIFSAVKTFPTHPSIRPSDEELDALADLLNGKEKITLFCGIGAKDAHAEVVELSGLLNSPVAYSFKSKMEIQYDNPNEVGMTGLLGMPSGYDSMHEAEVLVMLGTDFPYAAFMPENNTIVQVDIKPERLGRRAKVAMGLCGDVKSTLQALLPRIKQKQTDDFLQKQLKGYERVKENLNAYVEEKGQTDKIHPEYVMSVVDQLALKDAIFTVDTGMTCVWGARYLHGTGERRMLGSFNHGSMANAVPQAIGASLAFPERQVWALCGDEMEVAGLPDWLTDMDNLDFPLVAKAMGMEGFTVNDPEKVQAVLEQAMNIDGPVLVNVMTDPNALAMPPKVEWSQMMGFAQSMYKLMINGRTREILDTISSNFRHMKEVL